jgi:hypothetical protein
MFDVLQAATGRSSRRRRTTCGGRWDEESRHSDHGHGHGHGHDHERHTGHDRRRDCGHGHDD